MINMRHSIVNISVVNTYRIVHTFVMCFYVAL